MTGRRQFPRRVWRAAPLVALLGAVIAPATPARAAAAAVAGRPCAANAIGQTARVAGKTLVCTRTGATTVWSAAAPASASGGTGVAATGVEGTWTAGVGSIAGYRVRELFAGRPAKHEAVGRTDAVTGTVTIARSGAGLVVRTVSVSVDLRNLASNEARRDAAIKTRGLETNRFPTARFASTAPVPLPVNAAGGDVVSASVKGKLTLHGVTRSVSVPVQARVAGGAIEVVGQAPIVMKDYGIDPPSTAGVVTVDDNGTFELKLVLTR